jgi:preprotein translocase subunit SecA
MAKSTSATDLDKFTKSYNTNRSPSASTGAPDPELDVSISTSALDKLKILAVKKGLAGNEDAQVLCERYKNNDALVANLNELLQQRESPFPDHRKRGLGRLLMWGIESPEVASVLIDRLAPLARDPEFNPLIEKIADRLTIVAKKEQLFDAVCDGIDQLLSDQRWRSEGHRGEAVDADTLNGHIDRVVKTCEAFFRRMPSATFTATHLACTEVILEFSREPEHDLKQILSAEAVPTGFNPDALREYYDAGHHFIGHHDHFGPYTLEADTRSMISQPQVAVYNHLACLDNYPSFGEREAIARALEGLDDSVATALLSISTRVSETQASYLPLISLCRIIAQNPVSNPLLTEMIESLRSADRQQLIAGIGVLSDLYDNESDGLEKHAKRFLEGDHTVHESQRFKIRLTAHQKKYPEKPLEQIMDGYRKSIGSSISPMLSKALTDAKHVYEEIYKRSNELAQYPPYKVREEAERLTQHTSVVERNTEQYKIEYFTLMRHLAKEHFGVYPYNTQLIAALLFSNEEFLRQTEVEGASANIMTGEGKSLIIALVSAYTAATGRTVDVVTSNSYLAARDAERFSPFYEDLGIKCRHFSYPSYSNNEAAIIYSTSSDLIFEQLSAMLDYRQALNDRKRDVLVVDEADNLCIDIMTESCRIAREMNAPLSRELLRQIYSFVNGDEDAIHPLSEENKGSGAYQEARLLASKIFDTYYRAAHSARMKEEGRDYIVRGGDIKIIDRENTGRIREGVRWSNGVDEFLRLEHNLPLGRSTGVAALLGHGSFVKQYSRILCISGTIDHSAIRDFYGIGGFDVPVHLERIREDLSTTFVEDDTRRDQLLYSRLDTLTKGKTPRPVLLAMSDVNESKKMFDQLRERGYQVQLLNDADNRDRENKPVEDEELLISQIGTPGLISIVTNMAGRGVDPVLEKESLDNGGLHVIGTFVPVNLRVELQLRGRSGRQGQPGSSELIISVSSDDLLNSILLGLDRLSSEEWRPWGDNVKRLVQAVSVVNERAQIRGALEQEKKSLELQKHYINKGMEVVAALEQVNPAIREEPSLARSLVSSALEAEWTKLFWKYDLLASEKREPINSDSDVKFLEEIFELEFRNIDDSKLPKSVRDCVESLYTRTRSTLNARLPKDSDDEAPEVDKVLSEYKAEIDSLFSSVFMRYKDKSKDWLNGVRMSNLGVGYY